jgi:hypothetical protein
MEGKQMKHSLSSRLVLIVFGMACYLGIYTSAQAEYIAVGCFSGVFQSDSVTLLKDGDIVQCLYAGPDGKIDPPNTDGTAGGDDVLLKLAFEKGKNSTVIGASFPSDPDEGKFFDVFKYNLKKDDIIYCRAWNGKTFEEATCYGNSAPYTIQHTVADFNIFSSWDTSDCSCAITLEPKTKTVMPGESIQFEAVQNSAGFSNSGTYAGFQICGTTCYAWSVSGTSGGTITQTGLYTAGDKPGKDIVTVTDPCNNNVSASAVVTVIEQGLDTDGDGISDAADNCPNKPNGPTLGTCISESGIAGATCLNDDDCGTGTCSMDQEDTDVDGVGDVCDSCPESILDKRIIVGSCDSGVLNQLFDDGCTMSDLIADCSIGAKNHGKFVSCVSHLTNDWKNAGLISGEEKGAIQRCAAKYKISKKQKEGDDGDDDEGNGNGKGKGKDGDDA